MSFCEITDVEEESTVNVIVPIWNLALLKFLFPEGAFDDLKRRNIEQYV